MHAYDDPKLQRECITASTPRDKFSTSVFASASNESCHGSRSDDGWNGVRSRWHSRTFRNKIYKWGDNTNRAIAAHCHIPTTNIIEYRRSQALRYYLGHVYTRIHKVSRNERVEIWMLESPDSWSHDGRRVKSGFLTYWTFSRVGLSYISQNKFLNYNLILICLQIFIS